MEAMNCEHNIYYVPSHVFNETEINYFVLRRTKRETKMFRVSFEKMTKSDMATRIVVLSNRKIFLPLTGRIEFENFT